MNIQALLDGVQSSVIVAALFLVVIFLLFLAKFLAPGLAHLRRLKKVVKQLSKLGKSAPLKELREVFSQDEKLAHLWNEYEESLHVQSEERDGQLIDIGARATLPAEMYFNGQIVVDSRLGTEFFKHLPGIFTGIGIVDLH
ncbi:hypothetical protein [Herbaspirillum huttiense]|uniref:hypothetical protein n=1 Tax=Herbaspirillum huttiense TaxID=863372 RepID=UPI0039AFD20B